MMYNYELRDILIKLLKTNTKIELGNVYYKTKKGNLAVIDFVDLDEDDNLILSCPWKEYPFLQVGDEFSEKVCVL